jgi:hypothetical protein
VFGLVLGRVRGIIVYWAKTLLCYAWTSRVVAMHMTVMHVPNYKTFTSMSFL